MEESKRAGEAPTVAELHGWLDVGHALKAMPFLDGLRPEQQPDEALVLARAWRQLGRDRGADALIHWTGRRFPEDPEARLAMLRIVLGNQGSFAFWRCLQGDAVSESEQAQYRAELWSLKATWLASLRDGRAALRMQDQAVSLVDNDPWLWVERSYVLDRLDQHTQALEAAQHALRLCPGYRTGLLQTARLQQILGRREEAMECLQQAHARTGNAAMAWQLFNLVFDQQQPEQALLWLAETERGHPLAEKGWLGAVAARRADVMLQLGHLEQARDYASAVPGIGFYASLAARLTEWQKVPPKLEGAQRLLLSLPMVQQHWMTCAPATLTALAGYWGKAADHVEVAQAICYDGTPQASERKWAQSQGFVVREFKLDWPTTKALIQAGVPFALATQYVGGGHLQAVVGFDALRETLLVRDPSQPQHAEYAAEGLFAHQQAAGPRAMVMLPPEQAWRLEGLTLPEAPWWDLGHAVLEAHLRHDRPAALRALHALEQQAPDSDTTWRARRYMAGYDGDEPKLLAATEELLKRYPHDTSLQVSRLHSLYEVKGQHAGHAWLDELAQQATPDPALLLRWAARLRVDPERRAWADFILRRCLWRDRGGARAWSDWADGCFEQHGAEAAVEPSRWASTLQPTEEWAAANHARICRVAGQSERGLDWLRERQAIWGDRSGAPSITLCEAMDALQLDHEADQVLAEALLRRPSDNELHLFMAERALIKGEPARSSELLQACTETRAPALLRLQALLKESEGDLDSALTWVREAVSQAPFDLALHRLLLRLLRRRWGDAQALDQWRPLADAHPAHWGLQSLLYEALPDQPEQINAQLDHLQAYHPHVPWLQRERALQAARQNRLDEALALADQALHLSPQLAASHQLLAYCHQRRTGYEAARVHWRNALARDAEFATAMEGLLDAPDAEQCRSAADEIATELRRQPLLGDGLLQFQAQAHRGWSPQEILDFLEEQLRRWPALWQAPVAVALQLQRMQHFDRSLALLKEATLRFPGLPRVHVELAESYRLLARIDDAKASARQALALSPGWNRAVRLVVDLLHGWGRDLAGAEAVLQRALHTREAWSDADLIGLLGWVHLQQGRDADAWLQVRRSLCIDPAAQWVWRVAATLSERAEAPASFDDVVEEVLRARPGDAMAWLVRAQYERDVHQALRAAERAIELQPRLEAAWSSRLERLQTLGRFDEMDELLQHLPWPQPQPVGLRSWRAKVAWARGEHGLAVERLRELQLEVPHELSLCLQLADWMDARDDHAGYLEQAEILVRLAPQEARSFGYLGHALMKGDRPAPALQALKRALELSPDYAFAAHHLVQAALATGAPDEAEPALQMLWQHLADVNTACNGVEIGLAAHSSERALAWFERLLTVESFDIERCRETLNKCRRSEAWPRFEAMQRQALVRGAGPLGVALDWAVNVHGGSYLPTLFTTWRMQGRASGPYVPIAIMRWMVSRLAGLPLRAFIRRFGPALRADSNVWGEVSFALSQLGMHRALVHWLSDWQRRDRPPLFALSNLAGSLAVLGAWDSLALVVNAILARSPNQEDARLWQMVLAARKRDAADLAALLERCREWTPDPWMSPVLDGLRHFVLAARARCDAPSVAAFRQASFQGHELAQSRAALGELSRLLKWQHTPWPRLWHWL